MMPRIFVWCILLIQIVIILIIKGFIKTNITANFYAFFREYIVVLIYLLMINIVSFIAFALDKFYAINRRKRNRTATLLGISFIGGSVGVLLAMYAYRHKIYIDYFTVGIPLMMIMQLLVLFYIMNII